MTGGENRPTANFIRLLVLANIELPNSSIWMGPRYLTHQTGGLPTLALDTPSYPARSIRLLRSYSGRVHGMRKNIEEDDRRILFGRCKKRESPGRSPLSLTSSVRRTSWAVEASCILRSQNYQRVFTPSGCGGRADQWPQGAETSLLE